MWLWSWSCERFSSAADGTLGIELYSRSSGKGSEQGTNRRKEKGKQRNKNGVLCCESSRRGSGRSRRAATFYHPDAPYLNLSLMRYFILICAVLYTERRGHKENKQNICMSQVPVAGFSGLLLSGVSVSFVCLMSFSDQ